MSEQLARQLFRTQALDYCAEKQDTETEYIHNQPLGLTLKCWFSPLGWRATWISIKYVSFDDETGNMVEV